MIAEAREISQIVRFIAAGAANTAMSLLVYQAALFVLPYTASYALAYGCGVVFAYYAYAKHVFRVERSTRRLAAFAGFYVFSLIAGATINAVFVETLGLHPRVAVFATIAVTLPLNYLGSRWCLGAGRGPLGLTRRSDNVQHPR